METLTFAEADGRPLYVSTGQIMVVAKCRQVNLAAEQQWLKFPLRDDVVIMCTEKNFIFARIAYRLNQHRTEMAVGDVLDAAEAYLQDVRQINVFVMVPVDSQGRKFHHQHGEETRAEVIMNEVFSWTHDFFPPLRKGFRYVEYNPYSADRFLIKLYDGAGGELQRLQIDTDAKKVHIEAHSLQKRPKSPLRA
jgi:hypothetical protein